MNIPLNGRIIIIDDKIEEAQPLINVLSKKRIPFNYYCGTNHNEFPDNINFNKLRVLFLDLNIFELSTDEKSVISSIDAILKKVIPDYPNPFLLVIWSKKDKQYDIALRSHFEKHLPLKKPTEIIYLQKADYFDYDGEKWVPQQDCIPKIEIKITEELDKVSAVKAFAQWENLIHDSACEAIELMNDFNSNDDNWNRNTKNILYNLAKSISGNESIDNLDDKKKLEYALIIFSEIMYDSLDNKIRNGLNIDIGRIAGSGLEPRIKNKLNTKIHLEFNVSENLENLQSGNVYRLPEYSGFINGILDGNVKVSKKEEIIKSKPLLLEMDVTPICDHAQYKNYVRVLYGLAINADIFSKGDFKKNDFCYSDIPPIEIHEIPYYLLFDFRSIKFKDKNSIITRGIAPLFKVRHELFVDILFHLSLQVGRPGVITI